MESLQWLEETWLAVWVRESNSIWAYPTVLYLHTLGLAVVAGLSAALGLRVLGFGRAVPYAALAPFFTAIWLGFAVTVVSGTALLVADTSKLQSPVFYVKLVFVGLALVALRRLEARLFQNPLAEQLPPPRDARVLAASSLLFWVGATTAGRLIAYLG